MNQASSAAQTASVVELSHASLPALPTAPVVQAVSPNRSSPHPAPEDDRSSFFTSLFWDRSSKGYYCAPIKCQRFFILLDLLLITLFPCYCLYVTIYWPSSTDTIFPIGEMMNNFCGILNFTILSSYLVTILLLCWVERQTHS